MPFSGYVVKYRILPLFAMALALIGTLLAPLRSGMKLLAGASGTLLYSLFQVVLYRGTGEPLIGSLAHELLELLFLLVT